MKNLILSRKFWVALLALTVIIISAFLPGFDLKTEDAAGFAVVIVSYLLGLAVDPGPGGWRGVLVSRKFWAAVTGFALVWCDALGLRLPFDLTPEQLIAAAVVLGGYIAGVALENTQPAVAV